MTETVKECLIDVLEKADILHGEEWHQQMTAKAAHLEERITALEISITLFTKSQAAPETTQPVPA